jgi:hypothetical protein
VSHISFTKFLGYEINSFSEEDSSQAKISPTLTHLLKNEMKNWTSRSEYSVLENTIDDAFVNNSARTSPNFDIFKPKTILILCSIVEDQIYQNKIINYIGTVNTPSLSSTGLTKNYHHHDQHTKLLHYQPINPKLLHVCQDRLNSIKLMLVDENLQQLKLTTSSPTLVTLNMEMNNLKHSKMIYSSSADSTSLTSHPENNAGKFTHQLPQRLELNSATTHTIELLSVNISSKIYNMTYPYNKFQLVHDNGEVNKRFTVKIPEGFYPDLQSILDELQEELIKEANFHMTIENGKLQLKNSFENPTQSTVIMKNTLAVMLGLTDNDTQDEIEIKLIHGKVLSAAFHPKMDLLFPDFILIYLEGMVESSVVGGTKIPLLKIIPAPNFNSQHEKNHFDFNSSNKVKLAQSSFQTITYTLHDITGRILKFADNAITDCQISIV